MSWTNLKNPKYSWPKAYKEIKTKHDDAFRAIDRAIGLEEQEKPNEVSTYIKKNVFLVILFKSL